MGEENAAYYNLDGGDDTHLNHVEEVVLWICFLRLEKKKN